MSSSKKKILQDHKQIGKRFVPPLLELGPFNEVLWAHDILPELLWICLLYENYGLQQSAYLCEQLSSACKNYLPKENQPWLALASSYNIVPNGSLDKIRKKLIESEIFEEYLQAFWPVLINYPSFPLSRLFDSKKERSISANDSLNSFKQTLEKYFDRWDTPATFVQAHAVYIAFTQDIISVAPHVSLAKFPEVEKYPNTELSKSVASGCRSTVSVMFSRRSDSVATWSKDFWNRGLELGPCEPDQDLL